MEKIKMTTPLVEMDGDEMTRVIWQQVKDELILPFVELKTEYYDLGLLNRNATGDQVTVDSANATLKYGVAVKCATITPNQQRMEEYPELTKQWPSPNGTIRSIMGGTVFRTPIIIDAVKPSVRSWKKPITIARHAYGDVYKAAELRTDEPGECFLVFRGESGAEQRVSVQKVGAGAVFQGMHNKEASIRDFARACFQYAVDQKQDLWFSAKDTISKIYDAEFKRIFEEEFEAYRVQFEALGITYFYTLIDDAVARTIRSEGGYIWACKNYDGDVMSDMVSTAFGSLAMMTSVLVTPDGKYEFEAAHGTVTRHYYKYLKGEKCGTNPVATIFAWSGALKKRGELDGSKALEAFGERMAQATYAVMQRGIVTPDLAKMAEPGIEIHSVMTDEFIAEIRKELEKMNYTHPDLHLHSNASDGSDDPLQLLENVRASDVDIFALTDHDTFLGCQIIREHLREGDPAFLGGIELSCKDEFGSYHILGYCYDVTKVSIQEAADVVHIARMNKANNRFRFLEEVYGYTFTQEEKMEIMQHENPGKPHFAALLQKKGYAADKETAFVLLNEYHGKERRLTPEEAIDAILQADGIPVLAHGLLEDGDGHLTEAQMDDRARRLKKFGLMGLECYYSAFTEEQTALMLSIAKKYNLLVTAGSDYHGKNKTVPLGDSGNAKPEEMERFYRAVRRLLNLD